MGAGPLFSLRSARAIAFARTLQVIFLGAALPLGRLPVATNGVWVVRLLAVYGLFSVVLLVLTSRRSLAYRLMRLPILATAVDFAMCVTLLYISSGADSPFFSPWMFLLISATVQWGSRGAALTGALTILAFSPSGWAAIGGSDTGPNAVMLFVLRTGYLLVASIMLSAFAKHLERVVKELTVLSASFVEPVGAEPPLQEYLGYALGVFQAQSGLILYSEHEEPYASVVARRRGEWVSERLTPSGEDWLVDPQLDGRVFLVTRGGTEVFARTRSGVSACATSAVALSVLALCEFERALVLPFLAEGLSGWIFVFDHGEPANEDMAIGSLVSAQLSVALERWRMQAARNAAAAAEARIRLARDLHDGVLQFLAGAALKIESIMRSEELSAAAREKLSILKLGLADEQRELRGFITTIRPRRADQERWRCIRDELQLLAERLQRHWNINVESDVEPPELDAGEAMMFDLSRLVREAVANAVRHGRANVVKIKARVDDDALLLEIADNGCGFSFAGSRSDEELAGTPLGPQSVLERVRALGGRTHLRSTQAGADLSIRLPLSRLA